MGDHYAVAVKGQSREFRDDVRDCDARARAAAVFVALTLSPTSSHPSTPAAPEPPRDLLVIPPPPPPTVPISVAPPLASSTELPAAPAPPSPSSSSPPPSSAVAAWGTKVEIGAVGAMAPRSSNSQYVAGGDLRFIAGSDRWGLSLGASVPAPSTFHAGMVRVQETRYPLDVGVRRSLSTGWLLGALDVGGVIALGQLRQTDQPNTRTVTVTHVELGVRSAATLSAQGPRFGLYMRVFSEFIPVTRQIAVEPQGIIGRTSAIWIGVSVGVSARFH